MAGLLNGIFNGLLGRFFNEYYESEQEIFLVYDNTDNIHGENNQQLIENLRARTGINIHRYKITKVDYLKDIVELTAYYYENDNNNLLPKDQNEQQHEKPSEA